MTSSTGARHPDREPPHERRPRKWDWITVISVLIGIVIVLVATSELWMSHPWK